MNFLKTCHKLQIILCFCSIEFEKISQNEHFLIVLADFLGGFQYCFYICTHIIYIYTRMAYSNIIGREPEIETLEKAYKSRKSEFVAIYGRRRVGKSYLVSEVFRGKICFKAVGTFIKLKEKEEQAKSVASYRQLQLDHFFDALVDAGLPSDAKQPTSWREAFNLLRQVLKGLKSRRKVVFLDELPWLAGPQSSELISELGYFWNSWADQERNIVLIVCGSATSWMLDNVISDYGGLYGRLTHQIRLKPFTLGECAKYYKKNGFHLSQYEMAVGYMALGGVPYYMDKLDSSKTMTANLEDIFFKDERIDQEFREVYTGLYATYERYIDIVKVLGSQFYGMTRKELLDATGLEGGGTFSKIMENLQECGIVRQYPRYGKERVEKVYQLKDFFSLFYLHFIQNRKADAGSWSSIQHSSPFYSWAGITFELLVLEHQAQLKDALNIATISRDYCWKGTAPDGTGAQIDLVLEWDGERTDYLCEIKFTENRFVVDKGYKMDLLNKIDAFMSSRQHDKTHSIQLVMITTQGVARGEHTSCINQYVELEQLFK